MFTYSRQQHNHKLKGPFQKFPVLNMFIPYTRKTSQTKRLFAKMFSLTCVHTIYNNTDINTYHPNHYQSILPKILSSYFFVYQFGVHPHNRLLFQLLSLHRSLFHILHLTGFQIQLLIKSKQLEKITSDFPFIVPSMIHYYNNISIPPHFTFRQGILVQKIYLF